MGSKSDTVDTLFLLVILLAVMLFYHYWGIGSVVSGLIAAIMLNIVFFILAED